MALAFDLGLLCSPGSTFHKLLTLHSLGSEDVLGSTQTSVKLFVLLNQKTSLSLNFVISERGLDLEGSVVILSSHKRSESLALGGGLRNNILQLCDFNSILVLHAS